MFLKLQRLDGLPVTVQSDKITAYGPNTAGTGTLMMLEDGIMREVTVSPAQLDQVLFATPIVVPAPV